MSYPKLDLLTQTFIELGYAPNEVSDKNLKVIEDFVLYMYFGKDHKYKGINDARCISIFKSPDPKLNQTTRFSFYKQHFYKQR